MKKVMQSRGLIHVLYDLPLYVMGNLVCFLSSADSFLNFFQGYC